MSCGCVCVPDYELPSFVNEVNHTARKTHKCSECGEEINPGSEYLAITGKWDGNLSSFKMCLDCESIRNVFFCDGFEYGGLYEYLHEHILEMDGNISSDCLTKLTPGARSKVCKMIEQQWGDDDDEDE